MRINCPLFPCKRIQLESFTGWAGIHFFYWNKRLSEDDDPTHQWLISAPCFQVALEACDLILYPYCWAAAWLLDLASVSLVAHRCWWKRKITGGGTWINSNTAVTLTWWLKMLLNVYKGFFKNTGENQNNLKSENFLNEFSLQRGISSIDVTLIFQ